MYNNMLNESFMITKQWHSNWQYYTTFLLKLFAMRFNWIHFLLHIQTSTSISHLIPKPINLIIALYVNNLKSSDYFKYIFSLKSLSITNSIYQFSMSVFYYTQTILLTFTSIFYIQKTISNINVNKT